MKKLILFAAAFVFGLAVMAQKPEEVIKVNTETHNFGKIKQNVPVTYYFQITNTSNKPVVIESASASCGCTVPEKPAEPILPGKTDKVKVVYNAAALGPINKDVYLKIAGIDQQKVLHITGEVLSPEAFDALPKHKP